MIQFFINKKFEKNMIILLFPKKKEKTVNQKLPEIKLRAKSLKSRLARQGSS